MAQLEKDFQSDLIRTIKTMLPHALVFKVDTRYKQGSPDLIVLNNDRWGMLEVKRYRLARRQPNQQYYIDLLNQMSYAAFIHPENREDILNELQRALQA